MALRVGNELAHATSLQTRGPEAGAIHPHPVQDHRELARHRNDSAAMAADLGESQPPRLQRRPGVGTCHQGMRRGVQRHAHVAIAAVVDRFSDALILDPVVGQRSTNPSLREWHTSKLDRLPGLKFMRTLWVCNVAGGPFEFSATRPGRTALGLEEAHRKLEITPAEFDEVAAELKRTMDVFKIPAREQDEVLAAFSAHKSEGTEGSMARA